MKKTLLLTSLLIGGIFVAGCSSNSTPSPAPSPAPSDTEAPIINDTPGLQNNEDEDSVVIPDDVGLNVDLNENSEEGTYDNQQDETLDNNEDELTAESEEEM